MKTKHHVYVFTCRARNKQWFFHACRVGRVLFSSETYRRRTQADRLKRMFLTSGSELFVDGDAAMVEIEATVRRKRALPTELQRLQEWLLTHPPLPYTNQENCYVA